MICSSTCSTDLKDIIERVWLRCGSYQSHLLWKPAQVFLVNVVCFWWNIYDWDSDIWYIYLTEVQRKAGERGKLGENSCPSSVNAGNTLM